MTTTLNYAGAYVKDKAGNVGKVSGITENDKTKLQKVIDEAVRTTGDQTVAGAKTFTDDVSFDYASGTELDASNILTGALVLQPVGATTIPNIRASDAARIMLSNVAALWVPTKEYTAAGGNDAASLTYVNNAAKEILKGAVLVSPESSTEAQHVNSPLNVNNGLYVGGMGDNPAKIEISVNGQVAFSDAASVVVPTVADATDSSTNAASTAFVQSAISANIPDTSKFVTTDTEQTVSGHKTFTNQLNSSYLVVDKLAAIQSGTSFRLTPDTSTYRLDVTASGCDVDFSTAYNMDVPTITDPTNSTTKVASTAFVHSAIARNHKDNARLWHQGVFRGSQLIASSGAPFTSVSELHNAVSAGDFSNIYLGDWFILPVNGVDTLFIVSNLIPDNPVYNRIELLVVFNSTYTARIHGSASTAGGFAGSSMYTEMFSSYQSALTATTALGSRLVSQAYWISNDIDTTKANARDPQRTGVTSSLGLASHIIKLPSEVELLGYPALSGSYFDCTDKPIPLLQQINLYNLFSYISLRASYATPGYIWTRSIASSRSYVVFELDSAGGLLTDAYDADSTTPGLVLSVVFN